MKENKEKSNVLKIRVLIILALILGFIIGRFDLRLFTDLRAQETTSEIDRAVSAKHGYGMYLNFEYEIVTNSYGYFVVVKDRDNQTLMTAGLN